MKSQKKTPPVKTQKSVRTEENLLEASAFCIGNLGLENASITEIAKQAGTSRALVAHYFPKKELLFEKVVLYIAQVGLKSIDSSMGHRESSTEDQVLNIVRSNLNFFLRHKHYYRCFILFYHHASIDRRLRRLNTQFYAHAVRRLENIFLEHEPGVRASVARKKSEILYRTYFFAIQRYFTMDHGITSEQWMEQTISEIVELLAVLENSAQVFDQ